MVTTTIHTFGLYKTGLNILDIPTGSSKFGVAHQSGFPYLWTYGPVDIDEWCEVEVYLACMSERPPDEFKTGFIGSIKYRKDKSQHLYMKR